MEAHTNSEINTASTLAIETSKRKKKERPDPSIPQVAKPAMTVDEQARYWGVTDKHVYGLIYSGLLGHIKIGRIIRILERHRIEFEAKMECPAFDGKLAAKQALKS